MKYLIDEAAYNAIKMAKPWFWSQHKAIKVGTCHNCQGRDECRSTYVCYGFMNDFFCADWRHR